MLSAAKSKSDNEGDKEVKRIARALAAHSGNVALADAIVTRTAEARLATAGPFSAESSSVRIPPVQLSALLRAREAALVPPPAGTSFFHLIRQMMHAFGDALGGDPTIAAALEVDVVAYVRRIVPFLRHVCKVKNIRMSHFSSVMPEMTKAYFKWRVMRAMAAAERKAAAAERGEAGDDDDEEDEDTEEEDEGSGGEGAAGSSSHPAPGEDALSDTESVDVEDSFVPTGGDDGSLAGMLVNKADDSADAMPDYLQPQSSYGGGDEADDATTAKGQRGKKRARKSAVTADDAAPSAATAAAAAAVPAPAIILNEDEQDATITALLLADAEEELRNPSSDQRSRGTQSATARAIMERLAFANRRSRGMSALQYAIYARAREVGFTNYPGSFTAKKFLSLIPPPALCKTSLEVIGYLAYDRVGCIVEEACMLACGGSPGVYVASSEPVGKAVYAAVMSRLRELPPELTARARTVQTSAARTVELVELKGLRAQLEVQLRGGAATTAAVAAGADSSRDAALQQTSAPKLSVDGGSAAATAAESSTTAPAVSRVAAAAVPPIRGFYKKKFLYGLDGGGTTPEVLSPSVSQHAIVLSSPRKKEDDDAFVQFFSAFTPPAAAAPSSSQSSVLSRAAAASTVPSFTSTNAASSVPLLGSSNALSSTRAAPSASLQEYHPAPVSALPASSALIVPDASIPPSFLLGDDVRRSASTVAVDFPALQNALPPPPPSEDGLSTLHFKPAFTPVSTLGRRSAVSKYNSVPAAPLAPLGGTSK